MTHTPSLADRVDALEIHIAYQDQVVQDLNDTVTRQWAEIDRLSRQIRDLLDRVREAETAAGQSSAPEPPPPHY